MVASRAGLVEMKMILMMVRAVNLTSPIFWDLTVSRSRSRASAKESKGEEEEAARLRQRKLETIGECSREQMP